MDGKVDDSAFRHGQALPFIILPRPQDALSTSVVRQHRLTSDIRAQRLAEMLASIHEYANTSAPFRPYWRRLALHDIRAFRRDYLIPERAAFEAAVARSQARRAA